MNRLMRTLDVRDLKFVAGSGPHLYDTEDNKYLDFFADVGTASLGYSSRQHIQVLRTMIDSEIPFHAPNLYRFDVRDEAAELLCQCTNMDKVFFCNSGTEASEAAIKLARKYQRMPPTFRKIIWTYKGGFHGRTLAALAAGDGPPYHTDGFGPLPDGFQHFENIEDINWLEPPIAVMLSPVFGNNDVWEYETGWLEELRKRCDETGTLLIFDEVQSGSGRTGNYTYAQRVGVAPDIITLAKGVAMGCPVGVCLARGEVADTFTPGSHFSTFGGNPLSCASVLGMWDWLKNNMSLVDDMGRFIKERLENYKWARNVRGPGMLIGFDIDVDGIEYSQACLKRGLLIGAFRKGPGPVKITPPLNITKGFVMDGLYMMEQAYRDLHP